MTPETFIKTYEAALASQDWQQVDPLVDPDACVTFSSDAVHVGKTAVRLHQSSGANPMKPEVTISQATYRRYILGKQGLWPGRRWAGKEGTAEALQSIEAVQVDPVSVLTGSQEIVLWGRVQAYQPEFLNSLLYTERRFFDYGGGLMIYPMAELPYWRVMMERRKSEKRWATFAQANPALLDQVRQEIRERGPLRNRDLEGQSVDHYRASKDTGVALYYLWLTGELMSYGRHGKERIYDFLENIVPDHLQKWATEEEAVQFFTRKAICHYGFVSERDFHRILKSVTGQPVTAAEAKKQLADWVETNRLGMVGVAQSKQPVYFLAEDAQLIKMMESGQIPPVWQPIDKSTMEEVIFLSPLEFVSARGRAKHIFDFDYIWEIYKPEQKRQFGPYTMPVLYGDQLVARLDAKLDRQQQTLILNGLWLEEWFTLNDNFALALRQGLLNFAKFLGASQVDTGKTSPNFLAGKLLSFAV